MYFHEARCKCYDPEIHTVRCGKIHGLKLAAIKISSQRVTHCFFDLIRKNVEWKVLCGETLTVIHGRLT
jgi:hypothetical protein